MIILQNLHNCWRERSQEMGVVIGERGVVCTLLSKIITLRDNYSFHNPPFSRTRFPFVTLDDRPDDCYMTARHVILH